MSVASGLEQVKMRRYYKRENKGADLIERGILADKRVKELKLNITKSEERVRKLLKELEMTFVFQHPFFDEWFFLIADFYLPLERLIVEIDGNSHDERKVKQKEAKRLRWLRKQNIDVLRIKNKNTINMTAKQLESKIEKRLNRKKWGQSGRLQKYAKG